MVNTFRPLEVGEAGRTVDDGVYAVVGEAAPIAGSHIGAPT